MAYVVIDPGSPLISSVNKVEECFEYWVEIFAGCFWKDQNPLDDAVHRAKKIAKALDAHARREARRAFDQLIDAARSDGDG